MRNDDEGKEAQNREKKKWRGEYKQFNTGIERGKENRSFVLQLHHAGLISAALTVKCLCGAQD